MSTLAEELDEHLRKLDDRTALHVERLVREIVALTTPPRDPARPQRENSAGLLELAALAEPMGAMTNAEIDEAIYGR